MIFSHKEFVMCSDKDLDWIQRKSIGGLKKEFLDKLNFKRVQSAKCKKISVWRDGDFYEIGRFIDSECIINAVQCDFQAYYKDALSLCQSNLRLTVQIGEFYVFETFWAMTIMTERHVQKSYKFAIERAAQLYNMMRLLGCVNSIANLITSYCLIMENQQEFLHCRKVPCQFSEIANEYLLNYKTNIYFGIREFIKPAFQEVTLIVNVPFEMKNPKYFYNYACSSQNLQEHILNFQPMQQKIEFPNNETKNWTVPLNAEFTSYGFGFIMTFPYHKRWNANCFTLLVNGFYKMKLFVTQIKCNSICTWLPLAFDEKTTIEDMVNLRDFSKKRVHIGKTDYADLLISNTNEEYLSFPTENQTPSLIVWNSLHLFKYENGIAFNNC